MVYLVTEADVVLYRFILAFYNLEKDKNTMYEGFEECLHKHVNIITDKDLMLNKSVDANRLFENITKERVLVYERSDNND